MEKKPLRILVLKKNYLYKLKEWFYQQHQKTLSRLNHYTNRIKAPMRKRKEWFSSPKMEKNDFYISEMRTCKTSRNIKMLIEGKTIYPDPQELKINKATSPLKTEIPRITGQEKFYGMPNKLVN